MARELVANIPPALAGLHEHTVHDGPIRFVAKSGHGSRLADVDVYDRLSGHRSGATGNSNRASRERGPDRRLLIGDIFEPRFNF